MSVHFVADDRILLEEIVESTDQPEADPCGSVETVDDGSVTTNVTVAEVADTEERQPQQRQQLPQSKGNIGTGRRIASQNVALSNGNGISNVGRVTSRSHMEQEKRMRREIANSNERRRMQSINAGFQSLRQLLPHHEGEKLSKAAILQQTAEYIYQLEQEKTQLLSQNCQLKRLVDLHEGGDVPIKKRKPDTQGVVVSVPMHVSESGDEGLGSMSPEPLSVITVTTEGHSVVNPDVEQLKRQLERERHARVHLEKQMRAIQSQLYPERQFRDNQLIAYQPHEVIEHTDNVMAQETEEAVSALQVVSVMALPPVGSNQTVETSSPDPSSPPLSPQPTDMVAEEIKEEESRASTPKIVTFTQNQVFTAMEEPTTDSFSSSSRVTYATSSSADFKTGSPQYITASPSRSFSPAAEPQRLPSVLEAAMKAEPKVEVERLPSPSNSLDDGTPQARLYIANTSRQNLETIVEAIRHLEGDHLFSDEPAQDVPLALTNKQQQQQQQQAAANSTSTKSATTTSASSSSSSSSTTSATAASAKQRILHAEHFLQFHTQQQTQQRPGVIVVKHS